MECVNVAWMDWTWLSIRRISSRSLFVYLFIVGPGPASQLPWLFKTRALLQILQICFMGSKDQHSSATAYFANLATSPLPVKKLPEQLATGTFRQIVPEPPTEWAIENQGNETLYKETSLAHSCNWILKFKLTGCSFNDKLFSAHLWLSSVDTNLVCWNN